MCALSLLREVSRGVYSLRIWVSLGASRRPGEHYLHVLMCIYIYAYNTLRVQVPNNHILPITSAKIPSTRLIRYMDF